MMARLWWKDFRQFWPVWLLVAAGATVNVGLLIRYAGAATNEGELGALALLWTCLYALGVTAAAFAGERENGTLRWLDALGASRDRLWFQKAAFALVTTLALGLMLFLLAAVGTRQWGRDRRDVAEVVAWGVAFLVNAIGVGLFWSAVLRNALAAGALSVCTLTLGSTWLNEAVGMGGATLAKDAPWRLAMGLVAAAVSGLVFRLSGPPRRGFALPARAARTPRIDRRTIVPEPVETPSRIALAWQALRDRRAAWRAARTARTRTARSVFWQARREALALLPALVVIGIVIPFAMRVMAGAEDWSVPVSLSLLGTLVAGVNVFGAESAGKSYRFLAHHAARPRTVWLVKNVVWILVLAILWLPYLALYLAASPVRSPLEQVHPAWLVLAGALICFAVGELCGMAIPRTITAGLVGVVCLLLLTSGLSALNAAQLMGPAWLFAFPAVLLAVAALWTGDWIRGGVDLRRWVRLAVLLVVGLGGTTAAYIASRAYGVPESPPIPLRLVEAVEAASRPVPATENAADLYRQATRDIATTSRKLALQGASPRPGLFEGEQYLAIQKVVEHGWGADDGTVARWLAANSGALELVRRATRMPRCRFHPLAGRTAFNALEQVEPTWPVSWLLTVSVLEREAKGDLDGAWRDLLALFRFVRQQGPVLPAAEAVVFIRIETTAQNLAMAWAMKSSQSRDRLRKALSELEALGPLGSADAMLAAEAEIVQNSLALPVDELRAAMAANETKSYGFATIDPQKLWIGAATTPWERQRAKRVIRWFHAMQIAQAAEPPARRSKPDPSSGSTYPSVGPRPTGVPPGVARAARWTPLSSRLWSGLDAVVEAYDQAETRRRALLQILALRSWQLAHEDRWPDSLGQLVPSELKELPLDPYSGRPFGYAETNGQTLLPLGWTADGRGLSGNLARARATTGCRILYSVGPDRKDDGASFDNRLVGFGDTVFPLCEFPNAPPPSEESGALGEEISPAEPALP